MTTITEIAEVLKQAGFNDAVTESGDIAFDGEALAFTHSQDESLTVKVSFADPEWFIQTHRCMFMFDAIKLSSEFILLSRNSLHIGHIWVGSSSVFNQTL